MSAQPPYPAAPAGEPLPPPGYSPPGYPPGHAGPMGAPQRAVLARRHAVLFILLFLAVVGLAFFAPPIFLLSGDPRPKPAHAYNFFREGGMFMWVVLLFQMFVWTGTAVLGGLLIKGVRVPGGILFALALVPFGMGVLGSVAGAAKVTDAISGASVDPSQRARILAQGIAELTNLSVYGGLVSGFAMYLVALAAVLGLVAIDPAPVGPAPRSSAWIVALPVGLVSAIAACVARAALHVDFFVLDALIVFGLLTSGLLAAGGARILPALTASRNDDEAGRAFRQLLLAAAALAAAMVFTDRALLAASVRRPFDMVASSSIGPSERMHLLLDGIVPARRARPIVLVVDAVGVLGVFAAPLLAARGVKRKVSIAGVVAGAAAALTAVLAFLGGSQIDGAAAAAREPFAEVEKTLSASGITLPPATHTEGYATETLGRKPGYMVKSDGSLVDQGGADRDDSLYGGIDVAADAALPFDAFMAKAGAAILKGRTSPRIAFVLLPSERIDLTPLGPLAGLFGTDLRLADAFLVGKLSDGLPAKSSDSWRSSRSSSPRKTALAVLPDGDTGRLVLVTDLERRKVPDTWPLGADAASVAARKRSFTSLRSTRPDLDLILLAPAPGDTIGRITAQLQALSASRTLSPAEELGIIADRAALEAAPAASEAPAPATTPARPTRKRPGR